MTSTKVSDAISTKSSLPKLEIPTGLRMALNMFKISPEKIQEVATLALESGMMEQIIAFPETVKRVEKKLDAIIKHLQIEID